MLPLISIAKSTVLPIIKTSVLKYWRLIVIAILLSTLGFVGWYYSNQTTDLKTDIAYLNSTLAIHKSNETKLLNALAKVNSEIVLLKGSNEDLENDIVLSSEKINELEAKPSVLYIDKPPAECVEKLNWLKIETLKLKDRI